MRSRAFFEPVGKLDWSILSDNKTTAIARRLNMTELDTRAESNSTNERVMVGRIESSGNGCNNS